MSDSDVLNGINLNSIQNSSLLANTNQSGTVLAISLDKIVALPQVRSEFNDGFTVSDISTDKEDQSEASNVNSSINALAESIKQRGLQNPIIVRKAHIDNDFKKPFIDDQYVIVSGERRFRAVKLLHEMQIKAKEKGSFNQTDKDFSTIDCIVREYGCRTDVCLDQLTENIQRVDLDPFEIAASINDYKDNYEKEFGKKISRTELAQKFGKTMFWISQMMAYTEITPAKDSQLLEFFKTGVISKSARTGYELIKLYRKAPEFVLQNLNEYKSIGRLVDRNIVSRLIKYYEQQQNEEGSNLEIADSSVNQPGLILSSTNQINSDLENENDNDNDNDSTDYTEIQEREKSESPKMFAKNQENTAPTAGINATSSYTDRDTRETHDLSDSIHDEDVPSDDEYQDEYQDETEFESDEQIQIRSINCEYIDELGNTHSFELNVKDNFSSNTEITLNVNGEDRKITLGLIRMVSFNFV